MVITLDAPKGCGIRRDLRLRKLTIVAENVKEQEELCRAAALLTQFFEGVNAKAKDSTGAKL